MERLTFEGNFCDLAQCRDSACRQSGTCTQKQVWERLKAYEDAGLSPQACAEAREIEETLSGCDYSISRMVELMKADKDGRVIVLPAKKGDTLYAVTRFGIEKRVVKEIAAPFFYNSYESSDRAALPTAIRNFGKTVFLSREEAEKALQEMEGK
jgi:hypothetical protein|uniref:Uncharacterized protein n=1 Tax=Siphoviridae sp. cttpk5 TaxID=2826496 RepID=A0A8S5NH87_9CAUD|nr:MAG TPA: hypothetical protein [Siphoviridae sp. cttpk5]DAF21046.1 MAG TPA: hypothetical protein [Caudoviricetes sp.]DAX92556.1 MAG TPA: hypothetical protein [Caudoviricetes sp.]